MKNNKKYKFNKKKFFRNVLKFIIILGMAALFDWMILDYILK